jgi:tetratricopeptide (TPR) repeat protein
MASRPHFLITGGSRGERVAAAAARVQAAGGHEPAVWRDRDPGAWPFEPGLFRDEVRTAAVVWVDDVDRAFPNHQAGGTRLVLTQSTYLVQKLLDRLEPGALVILTAAEGTLTQAAPEAFSRRGPWWRFELVRLGTERVEESPPPEPDVVDPVARLLRSAYRSASPGERLTNCREAAARRPDAPTVRLALASAAMEQLDLDTARQALDQAFRLTPDWEAVLFERGKLWLAYDDMAQAREAFQRAADRMPAFSAALSHLGATLGELDQPEEGLRAFRQALAHDPNGFTILNNIGVVCRELGRLEDSEASFRRVIEQAPEFVFGHYNLGQTLFLQGRFAEAVEAFREGQRRDPERNARQACRLAMSRLAAGDPEGARRDLHQSVDEAPPDMKVALLAEVQEIAAALLAGRPDLPGGRELAALVQQELEQLL